MTYLKIVLRIHVRKLNDTSNTSVIIPFAEIRTQARAKLGVEGRHGEQQDNTSHKHYGVGHQ